MFLFPTEVVNRLQGQRWRRAARMKRRRIWPRS